VTEKDVVTRGERALHRAQFWTVVLLFVGYAGYYFCRVDLSVAMPSILDEMRGRGIDPGAARIRMGTVVSLGVFAYAFGKLTLAAAADFSGGKRNFVGGMVGAILCTLLFAASSSIPVFTLAWIGNRLAQSGGWAGLVKIASRWFDFSSHGMVMGVLSVSYLVGDAVARGVMGGLLGIGFGWRALFFVAAGSLLLILTANLVFLRDSRSELGFAEPRVNPINLFRDASADRARSVGALFQPFVTSPAFWIVCLLSLGTTLVRETFNTWTPTYFNQSLGLSQAQSAFWSSLFPSIGAVSVIVTGLMSDRAGARGRSAVMVIGLLIATVSLFSIARIAGGESPVVAVALVGVVALGLVGPYSCLAGAMAIDFGGRQGGAAASGLIDGVGYLGGVFAGESIARISVSFGWERAFVVLASVCLASALAAALLYSTQRSPVPHPAAKAA